MTHVAVLDIGKTNAKVALVDTATMTEIAVETRPNAPRPAPPYAHADVDGIWAFFLAALGLLHADHGVDRISITTHGATLALLDADGNLATPVMDYEDTAPDGLAEQYDALRPDFAATGSPRLPMGLNAGAQLHWLLATQEGLPDRVAQVVTYPQYWSGRLTGHYGCELTSLGCHTDLWEPEAGRFSSLVDALGLNGKMAPPSSASDVVGMITPEVAAATGLPATTEVVSGIHDSNASLYPHLRAMDGPFSVVSTGTWVVSMSVCGTVVSLDPTRDALINVNGLGQATPSARFMGGREYERMRGETANPTKDDVARVLERGVSLLPAIETTSGQFQGQAGGWSHPDMTPGEKAVALSFYLALMTAECLSMIGAKGPVIVEGPFARNALYLDMLHAATNRTVFVSESATGTSIGAALLADPSAKPQSSEPVMPGIAPDRLAEYIESWRAATTRLDDGRRKKAVLS